MLEPRALVAKGASSVICTHLLRRRDVTSMPGGGEEVESGAWRTARRRDRVPAARTENGRVRFGERVTSREGFGSHLRLRLTVAAAALAALAGAGDCRGQHHDQRGLWRRSTPEPRSNDFIELHNRSVRRQRDGLVSPYASGPGVTWQATPDRHDSRPAATTSSSRRPGQGGTTPLPTPRCHRLDRDERYGGEGRIVPDRDRPASCPSVVSYVDLVGYGSGTNCFEGPARRRRRPTRRAARNDKQQRTPTTTRPTSRSAP